MLSHDLNKKVEALLTEEPSCRYENVVPSNTLTELKSFIFDFLHIKENMLNGRFWHVRGAVHKTETVAKLSDNIIKKYLNREDAVLIGDTAFAVNYPHDIHIDSKDFRSNKEHSGIISYKNVVVPVFIDTDDYPFVYTANQYFYGSTTRFRAGHEAWDSQSEMIREKKKNGICFSYDYASDGVKYLDYENKLSREWYDENIINDAITPYSTYSGISIERENLWKPGDIIISDSARLHFSQNIFIKNATYKMGLSLNYGVRVPNL